LDHEARNVAGIADDAELSVGVSEFKPRSLDLIERVASGKLRRVVLTKRGRPIAAVVPIDDAPRELWGALAGLMAPVEGVDLTDPMSEVWAAEDG
jgi:prevent-host-death family protein